MTTNTKCIALALLFGCGIAAGFGSGGFFVGQAIKKFKFDDRTITVKGLVEKEVKSDLAIWKITHTFADDDLTKVDQKLNANQTLILDFLKKKNIKESDISVGLVNISDNFSREYNNNTQAKRYVGETSITVRATDVDLVQKVAGESAELVRDGVVLSNNGYQANPKFVYTKINDIKPELLAEAVKNARKAAEQFATDSGTKVGSIRTANQGQIQILSPDALESKQYESAEEERSITKKIRIVSTLVFSLVD